MDNYIVCCKKCNSKIKQDKDLPEFLNEDRNRVLHINIYLNEIAGYYYYDKKEGNIVNYATQIRKRHKILSGGKRN